MCGQLGDWPLTWFVVKLKTLFIWVVRLLID